MKPFIFSILILLSMISEAQRIDTIPAIYQFSTEKPVMIEKGSRIFFNADSIYLVNPGRYKFYEDLRELLNYDIDCSDIISAYQNSIERNASIINELLSNSRETEILNQKMLLASNQALNYSFTQLAKNDRLLASMSDDLSDLQKKVKKDKRRTIVNYFIIGVSGTLTGILISKI